MAQQGREVVIVDAVRTPVGRGHPEKGYYKDIHPADLLGRVLHASCSRAPASIRPRSTTSSPAACSRSASSRSDIARTAWLQKGLPDRRARPRSTSVRLRPAGRQLRRAADRLRRRRRRRRRAASSTWAASAFPVNDGAQEQWGARSRPELLDALRPRPAGHRRRDDRRPLGHLPRRDGRARGALAPRSHEATEEGRFEREMVPMRSTATMVTPTRASAPDTSLESLAALKPAFSEDGTHHGRQLVADLRRRGGAAADEPREGRASSA